MKNLKRLLFSAIFIALVILLIPTNTWIKSNVKNQELRHNTRMVPIFWVPGSSATVNRFDGVFKTINSEAKSKHSILKVKVMKDNTLKYFGSIRPGDQQPFIVVGFEDNSDGYETIKKEAKWFNIAFNDLNEKYQFGKFEGVGHSNGGLVLSFFLEDYNDSNQNQMTKLMTLGSPYNSYETSTSTKTQMLTDLIDSRKNIDSNLIVYSVLGTENYSNDGIVPEESVQAGKYVFQKQVKQYTQLTVTGVNAQHSDLPSNSQVIDLIEKNIIDSSSKTNKNRPNNAQDVKHKDS